MKKTNILSSSFIGRYTIDRELKKFAIKYDGKSKIVIDIGTGEKPYARFFKKSKYIGVDIKENKKADIVAYAWDIPLKDNSADILIMTQSLEHIIKTKETIEEVERILKKGGVGYISAPLIWRTHATPVPSEKIEYAHFDKNQIPYFRHDFWRFTKFGLIVLLEQFEILRMKESNGYFSTLLQLVNTFLKTLNIPVVFTPIYFINNLVAIFIEIAFFLIQKVRMPIVKKFFDLIYYSLPLNYIVIFKK